MIEESLNLEKKEFFEKLLNTIIRIDDLEGNEIKFNIVYNGLKIPYFWNKKNHTYFSDFYLPDYKIIIELKSNTIFYRLQIATGKQDAKNNAAIEFAKNNNMKFRFLFDKQIKEFLMNFLMNEIV